MKYKAHPTPAKPAKSYVQLLATNELVLVRLLEEAKPSFKEYKGH